MSAASRCIKLTYLNLKFIAEPIRLTLFMGDIPFKDERIDHEEVCRRRSAGVLPFGQVPVLNVDGKVYTQSSAILRWAGTQTGLYTPDIQLSCDEILGALSDINSWFKPLWFGHVLGRNPASGEKLVAMTEGQKAEALDVANRSLFPQMFGMLSRRLGDGEYFCGGKMTIADVQWYVMGGGLLDGTYEGGIVTGDVLKDFPNLVQLVDRVGAHPRVVLWNKNHQ